MKIMFVAAEGAPFAKTGGLGDVIGALPKSLVKNGNEVAVVLPYYDVVDAKFGGKLKMSCISTLILVGSAFTSVSNVSYVME